MDEFKKSYYTIAEAANLRGVYAEDILRDIREGTIKTKQVGMRMMIPAANMFNASDQNSTARAEKYLEQLKPDLIKMLETAPVYGSCGIQITFHSEKITKINMLRETTKLEEKKND